MYSVYVHVVNIIYPSMHTYSKYMYIHWSEQFWTLTFTLNTTSTIYYIEGSVNAGEDLFRIFIEKILENDFYFAILRSFSRITN